MINSTTTATALRSVVWYAYWLLTNLLSAATCA